MTLSGRAYAELKELAERLTDLGFQIVMPHVGAKPPELAARPLKDLEACDLLLADVTEPSHGVGFEIGYAYSIGKPVLLVARVSARPQVSAFLCAMLHDVLFYSSTADLLDEVRTRLRRLRPR